MTRRKRRSPPGCMNWQTNTVFQADNLTIMRGMNSNSVDVVYLDPPFNSKKHWQAPIGSPLGGHGFKDAWTLDDLDYEWLATLEEGNRPLFHLIWSQEDDGCKSYLLYMAARLMEIRRLLKPTGLVWLHCDTTMSHGLKCTMDCIFGRENFRNEVVRHYTKKPGTYPPKKVFVRYSDRILLYGKTDEAVLRYPQILYVDDVTGELTPRRRQKMVRDTSKWSDSAKKVDDKGDPVFEIYHGKKIDDVWNMVRDERLVRGKDLDPALTDWFIQPLSGQNKELVARQVTQKPLALLNRIMAVSDIRRGKVFLDPFSGTGTSLVSAAKHGATWTGVEISPEGARFVKQRLDNLAGEDMFASVDRTVNVCTEPPPRTDMGKLPSYKTHRKDLYGKQGGHCAGCKGHFRIQNLTVDHIIPRHNGGTDHKYNLQLLCNNCNSIKGTRTMEYLNSRLAQVGYLHKWN